jgi:WD40 repeat protein/serine/threonine protein kinase
VINPSRYASLSDKQFQELHATCETFEQALQKEERSSIEECLAGGSAEIRDVLFQELLAIELERQSPRDRASQVAAYRTRFPDRCQDIERVVQEVSMAWPLEGSHPIVAPKSVELPDRISDQPGDCVGHYKLLQRIGEGGMGIVYMAEQQRPVRRRVALKIIKLGMNNRQVIALFKAEGQTLAMMDHASITKVFDVGTTDNGRLFMVMELVSGIKITEYCDQHRLSTQDRLELCVQVCQAIQHAHQKGIIHRDLKPSNILVGHNEGVPVPKVIDFGVAKVIEQKLNDKTLFTEFQALVGTPAYMSPEQADLSSVDIDTRSDIYALGVLLYELLTGKPPFDSQAMLKSGLDGMLRTIRETEPPRPSKRLSTLPREELTALARQRGTEAPRLLSLVRGDLDWIVMKCLEKERARRYETANALAMDIKRHLNTEPVVARPPSQLYEFQKTVRRHKFGFAAATALIIVLAAGVLTSTWQAVEATRARNAEFTQRIAAQDAQAQAAVLQKKAEAERQRAEEQLTRSEWLVYASKIMLAQTNFQVDDGGLARHYLDECPLKMRGWEHRYLWTRINAKQTLVGHAGQVRSVAFSPDGKRIVTGSWDQTAKVWDAETGQELLTLQGHTAWVWSVAFSPDGKRIITGAGEWDRSGDLPGEAMVWDAETGQVLLALKGHTAAVFGAVFSPDGRRIVTGSRDGTVRVWEAETGQEVLALKTHTPPLHSVVFSPDGQRILTGGGDGAKLWDAEAGQQLLAVKADRVLSVAFSPDGQRILTGSSDKTASVWEAETGQEVLTLTGHTTWVGSVAFSPDGRRIVTGAGERGPPGPGEVKVWDAEKGQELLSLKGHTNQVWSVAFSPDGQRVVSGGADQTARVWDAEKGQEIPTLKGHRDFVSSIAFSPDSRRIVTGSGDNTAKVWDTETGKERITIKVHAAAPGDWPVAGVWSVTFSPDGQRIVTGCQDRTAKVWDAETGQELLALKGHTAAVRGVAYSPDGQRIVTGASEWDRPGPGGAKVWDAETGQELLTLEHPGGVTSVAFSLDGRRIATGSWDQTAKVWDAETGQEVFTLQGHTRGVTGVAFSPNGRQIVTSSQDQTAKVWDADTGRQVFALRGHTGAVTGVAFSPNGQRIVTGGDDRTARVWEAETGQEVLVLKGHTEMVWSVAFSPDGQRIATGIAGAAATAKVWHAEKSQEVLVNPPPAPPPGPARSPDGFRHAVPQGNLIVVTDERPPPKENAWPLDSRSPDTDRADGAICTRTSYVVRRTPATSQNGHSHPTMLQTRWKTSRPKPDTMSGTGSGVVFGQQRTMWKTLSPKTTPDPFRMTRL